MAFVALVAVAALPEMLIPQVPDAPVPVSEGMSVPIANPRFVRAPEAVDAPVPPFKTAKMEVRVAASGMAKLVPSDQTMRVFPAGIAAPVPAAVVLPITVEL